MPRKGHDGCNSFVTPLALIALQAARQGSNSSQAVMSAAAGPAGLKREACYRVTRIPSHARREKDVVETRGWRAGTHPGANMQDDTVTTSCETSKGGGYNYWGQQQQQQQLREGAELRDNLHQLLVHEAPRRKGNSRS